MCFYPCVSVCIQCVSHLNACMWACVACCLDTYINLQCVVKKINWQALRLSNLKQFNLPYSVPDVILPQWQLTVWQQAGRALTHTHTHTPQGQWQTLNIKEHVETVGCWGHTSGVSHCSMCDCVWRPFSTTQWAVLTLHVTQTDLWPFYTELNCAALLEHVCINYSAWMCMRHACMSSKSALHVCILYMCV